MNVNIGFVDTRNSSRVLKPPGGETSDIFGTREKIVVKEKIPEIQEEKKDASKEDIKVENGVNEKENDIKEEVKENGEKKSQGDVETNVNGEEKSNGEEKTNGEVKSVEEVDAKQETVVKTESEEIIKVEKKLKITQIAEEIKPVNKRVPPGGYSSGLW